MCEKTAALKAGDRLAFERAAGWVSMASRLRAQHPATPAPHNNDHEDDGA